MSQLRKTDAEKELETLRQMLKQFSAWPVAGDDFLSLMSQSNWSAPQPTPQDYDLLLNVADNVIGGMDIGAQYPAFFQKLLAHPSFRREFLATLLQKSEQ